MKLTTIILASGLALSSTCALAASGARVGTAPVTSTPNHPATGVTTGMGHGASGTTTGANTGVYSPRIGCVNPATRTPGVKPLGSC